MIGVLLRVVLSALITGGIHFYLWFRLVPRTGLTARGRRALAIAMVALCLSIPLTTAGRLFAPRLVSALSWVSMPWMGLAGLTFLALAAMDTARLLAWLAARGLGKRTARADADTGAGDRPAGAVSRRSFLARVSGGAAIAVGSASVTGGMAIARGSHTTEDVEIPLRRLPRALDGFTIVQLTDLHVGLTIDRAFVQRVVDHANRLAPDLIVLTGDLVDGPVVDLRDDVAPLADLRARHGVYAVTGNHEYYAGADAWIAELSRLGVRYLRNERVVIGAADAALELAGVDDYTARDYPGHGENVARAVASRDPARPLVLLAHQPRQVKTAILHGVDLQLSGHTHGGQCWPWHYLVRAQQDGLIAGHYQLGRTQLYVSRGCGYWGPPVRVLAPLEITRLVLRTAG